MGRSRSFVEPENRTDGTRRLKRKRPDVESLQLAAGFVDRALGERHEVRAACCRMIRKGTPN
jgi:hypothetical protein